MLAAWDPRSGGGPSPVLAWSGVEEINDTLSCWHLATPLLGLWSGPCAENSARVCGEGEVLCVRNAQLHADHLRTVYVPPELDGSPPFLSLGVAGSNLTWILKPWCSPVTRYRLGTLPAAAYPRGGASGCYKLEAQLYWGTYGELGV